MCKHGKRSDYVYGAHKGFPATENPTSVGIFPWLLSKTMAEHCAPAWFQSVDVSDPLIEVERSTPSRCVFCSSPLLTPSVWPRRNFLTHGFRHNTIPPPNGLNCSLSQPRPCCTYARSPAPWSHQPTHAWHCVKHVHTYI